MTDFGFAMRRSKLMRRVIVRCPQLTQGLVKCRIDSVGPEGLGPREFGSFFVDNKRRLCFLYLLICI